MAKSNTVTFSATDARLITAHETVKDYGASYLNPLVGCSASETCSRVESVIGFLHGLVDGNDDIEEARPAIALILQTVWSAVQYEREVSHG